MPETAPTNEKGHGGVSLVPWSGLVDTIETTPELMWPLSIQVYEMMRRTESQIAGVLRAITMPIRQFDWFLNGNGADPARVQVFAEDYGLPVLGDEERPRRRRKGRFSFDSHLRHAMLAGVFGHMFFEQYGETVPGPDGKLIWRLKKLAPRMPATIQEIKVARDGGLESIMQFGTGRPGEPISDPIPVTQLLAYISDQEGGNWFGQSWLRAAYRHWLIKDRLLRVDALKHERNGMGVPTIEAMQNATKAQMEMLDAMAQKYKAGEHAGGALPFGAKLRLVGVEGGIPDTLASIRYHDEQISKLMLVQFLDLGTTGAGNRALGEAFIDFFDLSLQTHAGWVADTFNAHQLEDHWDWNWDDGDQVPYIEFRKKSGDPETSAEELKALIESGALVVDDEVKDWVREKRGLPARSPEPEPPAPAPPVPSPTTASRGRRPLHSKIVSAAIALPSGRKTRRGLYDHEIKAATDFPALEQQFTQAQTDIVQQWHPVRDAQIEELTEAIRSAKALEDLANLAATPAGGEMLAEFMAAQADEAAELALTEAAAQGVELAKPDLTEAARLLEARAQATEILLARSISEAAGRQAVQRFGGTLSMGDIAEQVNAHLLGLSDAYLEEQLGGALQQAVNTGRKAVIDEGDPSEIYASELLDTATCSPCIDKDGTLYVKLEDAETDYPTGGFTGCLGGPRCRGTLVAIYGEAEAS